jgi:hypothetical protein
MYKLVLFLFLAMCAGCAETLHGANEPSIERDAPSLMMQQTELAQCWQCRR